MSVPDKWLKVQRNGKPVSAFYFVSADPDDAGEKLHLQAQCAVGLLDLYRPGIDLDFGPNAAWWWKQFYFLFEPADPRRFPSLRSSLDDDGIRLLRQYAKTARDIQGSGLLSASVSVSVALDDDTDEETVIASLGARDLQAGFAVLLRQCDTINRSEPASFLNVMDVLVAAAESCADTYLGSHALRILGRWREIMDSIHDRSLDQHFRDWLVAHHSARVLAWQEERSPRKLMSTYNYGDLIHWGDKRDALAEIEEDEYDGVMTRFQFITASTGIAHAHAAFGLLVEAAMGD